VPAAQPARRGALGSALGGLALAPRTGWHAPHGVWQRESQKNLS